MNDSDGPATDLLYYYDKAPFQVDLNGIAITVDKFVHPPNMGRASTNMAKALEAYTPQRALDMGCGTGFLALCLRRLGVEEVWAADKSAIAVACARRNVEANPTLKPLTVVESDLFAALPDDLRFDLVVFHQPYFTSPPDAFAGTGGPGGREVIVRFLAAAGDHLTGDGVILMSYQDTTCGPENDPLAIARELGHQARNVIEDLAEDSNRFVCEIRLSR